MWRQQPRKALARTINYLKSGAMRCGLTMATFVARRKAGSQCHRPLQKCLSRLVFLCMCVCVCLWLSVFVSVATCVAARDAFIEHLSGTYSIRAASCNNNEDCRQTDGSDAIFVSGSCCHCKHHETDLVGQQQKQHQHQHL